MGLLNGEIKKEKTKAKVVIKYPSVEANMAKRCLPAIFLFIVK
jgi:hypothetical protein